MSRRQNIAYISADSAADCTDCGWLGVVSGEASSGLSAVDDVSVFVLHQNTHPQLTITIGYPQLKNENSPEFRALGGIHTQSMVLLLLRQRHR